MLFTIIASLCFAYGMFWLVGGMVIGYFKPDFRAHWRLLVSTGLTWSVVLIYCITTGYPLIWTLMAALNMGLSFLFAWSRRKI